jgi:hypothetical protein
MRRKDKESSQAEQKIRQLEERKAAKLKRRGAPELEREGEEKPIHQDFLIVCEGKNTEPSYFNQFKLASATIEALGKGNNTLACVRHAQQLSKKKKYDQIWCVFDKDDFPNKDFNDAIKMAETNGFYVAYSNMSFEYWMILHFDDHQGGGMHRSRYDEVINKHLKPFGIEYEGEDTKLITEDIFDVLMSKDPRNGADRVKLAIDRAERNYDLFDHSSPAIEESSTTVFRLVKELLKYKD